jgi:hypothetical protein
MARSGRHVPAGHHRGDDGDAHGGAGGERADGRCRFDGALAHISPAHSENINFFGSIDVDIDAELAQLGPTGYRPLRVTDTLF